MDPKSKSRHEKRPFKTFWADLFCVSKWTLWLLTSQIPSLCPWMIVLCFCCEWQEGTQFLPKWTQHFIDQGTRETVGGGQKRMRGERDRWMEEAEREDCEGGTDGVEKGDSSEEGNWGLREEGDWVNREERNGRGWRGVQNRGGKIRVKRACLLWQSPRPSVLPCSTSCSKADLRGTETSWSAAESRPGHAGSPHLTK